MVRDEQGIWEKFIPHISEYAAYKYSVWAKSGDVFDKSDPYGFHFETRPGNATKAYDIEGYEWNDASWLAWRKDHLPYSNPVQHLRMPPRLVEDARGPGNFYSYRQLADELVPYVKEMGYTPHRVHAADRIPVRRLMGLSGHRLLRPRPAATARPRT